MALPQPGWYHGPQGWIYFHGSDAGLVDSDDNAAEQSDDKAYEWHPDNPMYKRQWCDFHWRKHGCRNGDHCNHAHGIADYKGPYDQWVQWYIDRGLARMVPKSSHVGGDFRLADTKGDRLTRVIFRELMMLLVMLPEKLIPGTLMMLLVIPQKLIQKLIPHSSVMLRQKLIPHSSVMTR